MNLHTHSSWIAFAHTKRIASGAPREVITEVKAFLKSHSNSSVLVFDMKTSSLVELDLRGSLPSILKRLPAPQKPESVPAITAQPASGRMPGRPKLGVIAREVTLLPRHWEWLATQPGGASVALRKLVEQARRDSKDADRIRQAQESAYRFMSAMAGNELGYEEAVRALFAGDIDRLRMLTRKWPGDVRGQALTLAEAAIIKSSEPECAP